MYQSAIMEQDKDFCMQETILETNQMVSCKRCGKQIPYTELYKIKASFYLHPQTGVFVYLCPDCFKELDALF